MSVPQQVRSGNFFVLLNDKDRGWGWRRSRPAPCVTDVSGVMADPGVCVGYSEDDACYYVNSSVAHKNVLRTVLAAPWVHRDADDFRVRLCVYNRSTETYVPMTCSVRRYDLAGRWGQLLKDAGDAACRSGIVIALIDAFLWMRNFLVSPFAPSVSLLYPVVGLFVGGLLYALGLFLKYMFGKLYGWTPAVPFAEAGA